MSAAPEFDSHVEDYEAQCERGLAVSGESKEFFARGRLAHLRARWQALGCREPERILDYGCGIGDVTALLAQLFPAARVVGLDPSGGCVERARRERAGARVGFERLADAAREPRASLIHLNGVVHHVAAAERGALFADVAERLAPSGLVAVFENNPLNPGTRLVMARIPFDRGTRPVGAWALRRNLRSAHLEPLETRYLFYFPRPLRALRGLERYLTRLPLGAQYCVLAARATR